MNKYIAVENPDSEPDDDCRKCCLKQGGVECGNAYTSLKCFGGYIALNPAYKHPSQRVRELILKNPGINIEVVNSQDVRALSNELEQEEKGE